jgi:hypothetical protein
MGGGALPFRDNGMAVTGFLAISGIGLAAGLSLSDHPAWGGTVFGLSYLLAFLLLLPAHRAALGGMLCGKGAVP